MARHLLFGADIDPAHPLSVIQVSGGDGTTRHVIGGAVIDAAHPLAVHDASGGGGGGTAHSALTGLSADDHPQYLLIDGSRAMTGPMVLPDFARVYAGASLLMHNYADPTSDGFNMFMAGAGNLTMGPGGGGSYLSSYNIGIGYQALMSNTQGFACIAIGYQALKSNTTPDSNIAIGYNALVANTVGASNIAVGFRSLLSNINGSDNIAIGSQALTNTIGSRNTAVGSGAGVGNSSISSSGGVFVGYQAGNSETGSNKLFIDNQARASEADARVKTLIYGVFDAAVANQLVRLNAAAIELPYLPAADPHVAGRLWANAGIVTVSAG